MHAPFPPAHPASPPLPARWQMPLLLKASVGCHLGAAALALAQPALWPWALGAVALDHALVTGAGDRKSTRLNSSHIQKSRMPSSA